MALAIYEVITVHLTSLLVDLRTGHLCHGLGVPVGYARVYCWMPPGPDVFCCLLPATEPDQPMWLDGDREAYGVIGLFAEQHEAGVYQLRHPLTRQALGTWPATEQPGRVTVDDSPKRETGQVRLRLVSHLPQAMQDRAAALEVTFKHANTAADAASLLETGELLSYGLPAVLRALPADEMAALGRAVASNPRLASQLARTLSLDPWAAELPGLAAGHRSDQAFERSIGPAFDHLSGDGLNGRYVSTGQMLNSQARRCAVPSKTLCVVASARNEGLYLLEWLAYYRLLGADAFFLYTNDNDDGSDELLSALVRAGVVNWIRNETGPGANPQYKAYGHACQMLPEILDYRWAALVDLDEFIGFDTGRFTSFSEFLARMQADNVDAVALNWVVFPSNGQARWDRRPVVQRFRRREPDVNVHVKSVFRPSHFLHAHCHFPIWDNLTSWRFRSSTGRPHPKRRAGDGSAFSPEPSDKVAWVNHYLTKSAEEFALRRTTSRTHKTGARPAADALFNRISAEWFMDRHTNPDLVEDDRALHCAERLEDEIAWLTRLPGVADAVKRIEATYRDRARHLARSLRGDPRLQQHGTAANAFCALLPPDPAPLGPPPEAVPGIVACCT